MTSALRPPLTSSDARFLKSAAGNHFQAVAQHIKLGASLNVVDSEGRTALHLAATFGGVSTCALLLEHAPHLALLHDHERKTPLMAVARRGGEDTARLLIPVSDLSARDRGGLSAMHHCFQGLSFSGYPDATRWAIAELIEAHLMDIGRAPEAFMQLSEVHGMLINMDPEDVPDMVLTFREALLVKLEAWRERWDLLLITPSKSAPRAAPRLPARSL